MKLKKKLLSEIQIQIRRNASFHCSSSSNVTTTRCISYFSSLSDSSKNIYFGSYFIGQLPGRSSFDISLLSFDTASPSLRPQPFVRSYTCETKSNASTVLQEYHRRVAEGHLQFDPTQEAAAKKLELFYRDVESLISSPPNILPSEGSSPPAPISGVYLWGGVGTGKTMLMDTFVSCLDSLLQSASPSASSDLTPPPILLRLHFHEFMADYVHKELHRIQSQRPKHIVKTAQGKLVYRSTIPSFSPNSSSSSSSSLKSPSSAPPPPVPSSPPTPPPPEMAPLDQVSLALARRCRILCLDELHVTDVADAMVLSRLLGNLLHLGVRVIFTSNSPPTDLYKGGLSRHYFLPFVRQIQDRLTVVEVTGGGRDFRIQNAGKKRVAKSTSSSTSTTSSLGSVDSSSVPSSPAPVPSASASSTPLWIVGADQEGGENGGINPKSTRDAEQRLVAEAAALLGMADKTQSISFHAEDVPSAYGRNIHCERVIGRDTVVLDFEELCGSRGLASSTTSSDCNPLSSPPPSNTNIALSPSDYIALCNRFPRMVIVGLCQFTLPSATSSSSTTSRDAARRLVSFLDMASQHGSHLLVSSNVPPGEVFNLLIQNLDLEIAEMEAQRRKEIRRRKKERELLQIQMQEHQETVQVTQQALVDSDCKDSKVNDDNGSISNMESNIMTSNSSNHVNNSIRHIVPGLSASSQPVPGEELVIPTSLKHEERLMYRRATSRLLGLCPHVQVIRKAAK